MKGPEPCFRTVQSPDTCEGLKDPFWDRHPMIAGKRRAAGSWDTGKGFNDSPANATLHVFLLLLVCANVLHVFSMI